MAMDNNVVKARAMGAEWKRQRGGKWGALIIASTTKKSAGLNIIGVSNKLAHT